MITFGSIAKTSEMPENIWYSLKKAMKKFNNINFIVKYENIQESIKNEENIYFTNWIPQMELMSRVLESPFLFYYPYTYF